MKVALKIWRFDPKTGQRALRDYEVDAPEEATLLDVLDIVKDKRRRDARLSQELPDDDLRLLRHAHGRRRRARLQGRGCTPIVDAGHVPVISAMGNLPVSRTSSSTWSRSGRRCARSSRTSQPGYADPGETEHVIASAGAMDVDPQGGALHQVRLLRLGVQLDGVRPGVPRPGGAREGHALRRRPARRRRSSGSSSYNGRARDLGLHALLLLQRALPEGRRPARRDREARRRGDEARASTATWARSTRSGSSRRPKTTGWLRETELVPKTQGIVALDQGDQVRDEAGARQARCRPVPAARREGRRRGAGAHELVKQQGREGALESSRARRRSSRIEFVEDAGTPGAGTRDAVKKRRVLQGLPRVAVGEGARHLDAGARAEARARARSSSSRSPAAAPATSTRPSPTTTCT